MKSAKEGLIIARLTDGVEQHLTTIHPVGDSRQQPDTGIFFPRILCLYGRSADWVFMETYRNGEEAQTASRYCSRQGRRS